MKPIMIQFDSWRFVKEYVGYVSRYISYGFPRFLYCYPSGNLDWIVSQIESLLLPEYRQHFDLFYPRIEKLYSVIVSQYLSEPSKFVKQENTLISPSKRQKILKLSLQGSLRSNSFRVSRRFPRFSPAPAALARPRGVTRRESAHRLPPGYRGRAAC